MSFPGAEVVLIGRTGGVVKAFLATVVFAWSWWHGWLVLSNAPLLLRLPAPAFVIADLIAGWIRTSRDNPMATLGERVGSAVWAFTGMLFIVWSLVPFEYW